MRRQPFPFRAFFALAVFWLAASMAAPGASATVDGTIGSVHGETMVLSPSHAATSNVSAPRKAPPADWASRLFLPPRGVALLDSSAAAPPASTDSRIGERERLTFTYDATAPPGEIPNTVH